MRKTKKEIDSSVNFTALLGFAAGKKEEYSKAKHREHFRQISERRWRAHNH